ncbi:MAG: hypothetical protein NXI11_00860, partial [Proteobacteria bacterium]|nr:hypothetical protein [Pseudomonadota bacterium]
MTGDNRTELVRTPKRVFRCQSLKLCVAGACGVFGYLGIDDELLAQIGRMRRNRNVEKRELWLATATARILFHRGPRDNGALTFRVNAPLS